MGKTASKAKPKDQRGRILRAAAAEIAARGFSGARVDTIARRAGVNKAMLYYHVGSKGALYEAVISEAVAFMWSEVQDGVSKATTPEARLTAIAEAFEAVGRTRPYMPRIVLRELATGGRLPGPMVETLGRIVALEQSITGGPSAEGSFRKVHPATLHILLVAGTMLHMVAKPMGERLMSETGISLPPWPEAPGRAVADLVLRGVLAKPGEATEGRKPMSQREPVRRGRNPRRGNRG